MSLKSFIRARVFGPPGTRPRKIWSGLLRGYVFPIDTACSTMQIVGLWEREIVGAVRRAAKRAQIACDIGANTGFYSLYLASRPNITRLFAFEPDSQFRDKARENLQRNSLEYVKKSEFIYKFVGNRNNEGWCRIDDVLRGVQGNPMLKIDVDGGELDVLRGARETLSTRACQVVIETHSPELERDCEAFLRECGYEVKIIKNGWYRAVVPEGRTIPHNRWLAAWKPGK